MALLESEKNATSSETSKILETARHHFHSAANRLELSDSMIERVGFAKEKIRLRLHPVLKENVPVSIDAFIVRYSDALGPAKGGVRMTADVTEEDIEGLAMEMTWKTSLIGVPFGGGKAGIKYDSSMLNSSEKEIVIRAFTRGAMRHIGPEIYIPAPDMGTKESDMGYIRDCISYSGGTSITRGCYVTGKPLLLGGIPGRRQATGKGVVYTIEAASRLLNLNISKMKVCIQGFGNVGSIAARDMYEKGAKIIAVQDISGSIINTSGLDIKKLQEHVRLAGTVSGFKEADLLDLEAFFAVKCDCFIPAAAGSQITAARAKKMDTKIVAEGANAPMTTDADQVLENKGVFIIPDILCNAGGVFVSYLEYTQETQYEQKTKREVEHRLRERMMTCFSDVYSYASSKKQNMRQAAMDIAVKRVVEGTKARGFLP